MDWIALTSMEQLDDIQTSGEKIILFKHSTSCPISAMAKRSLEYEFDAVPDGTKLYLLDLIRYRSLSNFVADHWAVRHESPQLLIIQGDTCIYHTSHEDVSMDEALNQLQ